MAKPSENGNPATEDDNDVIGDAMAEVTFVAQNCTSELLTRNTSRLTKPELIRLTKTRRLRCRRR